MVFRAPEVMQKDSLPACISRKSCFRVGWGAWVLRCALSRDGLTVAPSNGCARQGLWKLRKMRKQPKIGFERP